MVYKVKGTYRYLGTPQWDLSSFYQLPIAHPYADLEFTVYHTQHRENEVLVKQCLCPADLQLVAFKDFGTLRAGGGHLQWRNVAVALESGILDLCDPSVVALLLTAAYQVGPLSAVNHWNYDLTESNFVEELCHCVQLVMDRIESSWNSSRSLYLCICLLSYVADHTAVRLSDNPLNLLSRCRKICIEWSDSIEKILPNNSKAETTSRHLYFVNGLVILTFGAERSVLPDDGALFDLLRARTIMYERNLVMDKDAELDHLAALCIRTTARHQLSIHQLIRGAKNQTLNRLVKNRWNPKSIGEWNRCSSSSSAGSDFYWAECVAQDDTCSVVHIEVVEGTFLVDGEPVGRLPEQILTLKLFQRVFPDASLLAVFHRGGGVFETKSPLVNGASFTFALKNGELIIREIDGQNVARRLLPWQSFHDDLPQNLVEEHIHWMTYRNPDKCVIELRPLKDQHSLQPVYAIQLNENFQGQVLHCETSRKMLNVTGVTFDHIYRTVGWRLDQKRYIEPYWPTVTKKDHEELADNWSVCLNYPRLHLHMEICIVLNTIKVTVLEYENMVVSPSQYFGSFIRLKQMLVLERPNGLRTVIIPHFEFQAVKRNIHHCLEVVNNFNHSELGYNAASILDLKYTSFAFDEDRSLGQMRPNGEETYEKWLMCSYLHGATCSAMADPLTRLTGLEMALTQLRRCRVNKPLSEASLTVLKRIEQLAVKRNVAYDTQLVNWPDVHSSYSSSDAYILLVDLIRTKSMNLSELYGTGQKKQGEDCPTEHLELFKHDYIKYEWIYSPAARLDGREKRKLGITLAESPIIPFTSNVLPNSCSAYKLIHAGMCTTALKDAVFNENFSWVDFIQKFDCVSPADELEMLHVGYWTELCFDDGSMWLTLLAEAISCHSTKGDDQVLCLKQFIHLLSFATWKLSNSTNLNRKHSLGTYITALGKLLKLAMSSNDSNVTALLPSIEHLPSIEVRLGLPSDRFLNENKINFGRVDISEESFTELAEHWSLEEYNVRSELDTTLWDAVKRTKVWTKDTLSNRTIAITTERSPVNDAFLHITSHLPIEMRDWENYRMVKLAQEYYEELFYRQQLYAFVSQLDNQDNFINRASIESIQNCPWPCIADTSLDVALLKKPDNSVYSSNDFIIGAFDLVLKDEKNDGQCPELEDSFRQCLIEVASLEVNNDTFPLRFRHGFEERPISTDLISKLRCSWEHHQRATENATQFQPANDIRQKLNLIWERTNNLCEESWADIIRYFKDQREDELSRIQSAARVFSPVAPRILFPLYGRGDLPVAVQRLIEKHLIYQVYAQKAKRCLLLLDTTEAVEGEDRKHSAVRLVAEISEPHCGNGGWTPKQRPKWLLFEVENNVIIRKKQVLVANAIIAGNNQILQLNMGEGMSTKP